MMNGGPVLYPIVDVATAHESRTYVWDVNTLAWVASSGGAAASSDVNVTNASIPVTGTFFQATQPVSIASMPATPVTDNNGSLTVDGAVSVSNFPSTQPVSGTFFQATQPVSLASVPAHAVTGPLTDAELRAADVKVTLDSEPVAIAGTVPVSGTFWQATQPVSGTFFQATQPVSLASVPSHAVTGPLTDAQLRASAVPVSGTFWQATQPVSGTFFQATQPVSIASMPATPVTDNGGSLTVDGTFWQATQPVSGTFWQTTQPVSIAATVATKETRSATATVTSIADSASNQTLLASNANRLGATIYNDSTAVLHLKLGATASATSFTVKMAADSYYEVPANYTGIIDGLWASDASGFARITELT